MESYGGNKMSENIWTCECGQAGKSGKFCINCGKKKPEEVIPVKEEEVVEASPVVTAAPVAAAPAAPAAPAPAAAPVVTSGTPVNAPMPGTILDVKVAVGQSVKEGDLLVILEAMKMENEIYAPCAGTVAQVLTSKGSSVDTGSHLLTIS